MTLHTLAAHQARFSITRGKDQKRKTTEDVDVKKVEKESESVDEKVKTMTRQLKSWNKKGRFVNDRL